nr:immunoglobulin heavy chain junction region [Macaca mulatta]MOW76595.1 immunoglobulin heavy chain junction region [Macaca mulatta]MOW84570.1 immunoglobulin heavy chain junction region [Macaca mulatta]MOY22203.1 immunoglobulin heavy chain junction region [Macaca mulatta]MOY22822.1 immunoglobulin heavy chain junction region [Macaca mulatta]
CARDHSGFDCW